MVYQATITPKCSIYSDSTMVYIYYGETKSEYHQIPKPKFNIVPRAYIGRYTTANRKMKHGISTPDCIINSALFIMHYTILT